MTNEEIAREATGKINSRLLNIVNWNESAVLEFIYKNILAAITRAQSEDKANLDYLINHQHRIPGSGNFYFDGIRNGMSISQASIRAARTKEKTL